MVKMQDLLLAKNWKQTELKNHGAGFLIRLPWQPATDQLGNFATLFKFENRYQKSGFMVL